jgi:hypothetical protein
LSASCLQDVLKPCFSKPRLNDHVQGRVAAASVRHPQLGINMITNRRNSVVLVRTKVTFLGEGADLPAPHRWSLAAKGNDELASQRDDHGLARAAKGVSSSFPIPLGQHTILLM